MADAAATVRRASRVIYEGGPGSVKKEPYGAAILEACRPRAGTLHVNGPAAWRNQQMIELLAFISYLLWLYVYVLIAAVVFSWLVAFNVVNTRSPFVGAVGEFLYRVTDPLLRPIRNALPNLGGIDISPLVLMLIIMFITNVVIPVLARSVA
jgi:YggT family protein